MPLPDLRPRVSVPALLGSLVLALSFASAATGASSDTVPADVRVVDSDGATLTQQTQYTSTDPKTLTTDPGAECFGPGTGGSGERVSVPGSTALTQLVDARSNDPDVRPLSVSDSFSFGLALCGIGDAVSTDQGFLYLKQNHVAAQTGADATIVRKGDEILWFLIEDFNDPIPDELVLSAPARAGGEGFTVKVLSYADDGAKTPAVGVQVSGASAPTGPDGTTTVSGGADLLRLVATRAGSIPSNEVVVCTEVIAKCKPGYARTIGGTDGNDRIVGGKLAETIRSGAGDDRIDVSRGGSAPDLIRCGPGKDTVKVARKSRNKMVGCERIRPRR